MSDADTTMKTVKHDWSRADAMTDKEVHAAAMNDPDARPISDEEFARARRVPRARSLLRGIRYRLALCATGNRAAPSRTSRLAPT